MPRDSANSLDPDDILAAYALGYFPMAKSRDASSVVWVLPDERGVLPLDEARAPKKLLRLLRRGEMEARFNTAFPAVIEACAAAGRGREDTWINDQILEAYCELHFRGIAHSVECWRDEALVGGLYGVAVGGVFCGESMFSRVDNASKIAMLHLIARLRRGGFTLLDTQFHTDHLAQFGVRPTPNADYLSRLSALLSADADFARAEGYSSSEDALSSTVSVWQSITQTS